jgi:hypothetical protein
MPTFDQSDDLEKAEFRGVSLSGARFVESNLSGVVMSGWTSLARTSTPLGSSRRSSASRPRALPRWRSHEAAGWHRQSSARSG